MAKVSKQKKREIERAKWVGQLPKDSATALVTHSRYSYSYIENRNESNDKAFIQAQAYYVSAGWKAKSRRKGYVRGSELLRGKLYTVGMIHRVKDEISESRMPRWKDYFSMYNNNMGIYLFDKNSTDLYLAEKQITLSQFFFCGRSFNQPYGDYSHPEFYKIYKPQDIVSVLPLDAAMNFSYANSLEWPRDMSKVYVLEALVAVKDEERVSLRHCYFSPENIMDILTFKRVEQSEESNV